MADTSLVFNLLAKDKVSGTLGKVGGKFDKLAAGIVAGGVAIGAGLAKVGSDFAEASNTIQVGTGATGKALEGLNDDFKAVLDNTPADMQTVSAAIADLNTMTGAAGDTLQGMTTQVLEASRMLGEDGTANAKAFGQAMQQWQIPAEQGAGKLDKLFKVTQDYGVGLGDLTGHLNNYGSVLQNAGFSMEETAVLFGQLNKSGLGVTRVMPGLNKAFRTWADEGKNVQTELGKTISKIEGAESGTEALKIATEVFGAEGAQRMVTAIRSGSLELGDLQGALKGAEGGIAETAAGTETWQEKLQKLKNKGLVAIEPAATAVFDALGKGADILSSVSEWAQKNTTKVKALAIALGTVAAIIVAVNAGLKVYRGIQMAIRAATIAWTAVQWLLNVAMTANPVGLIIVAIAALIAIIVLIATKTTWFQDLWRVVWGGIKAAALATWNWIKTTLWENGLKKFFDFVVKGAKGVWEGIKLYFGFWKGILDKVISWVVGVWTNAKNNFDKIVGFVKNLPGKIRSAASGMWDGIKDAFRSALNTIISWWNNFSLSVTVPDNALTRIAGLAGKGFTINTPNIPHLAEGGIITSPTLALLGEAGRDEAVVPLPRGMRPGDGASMGEGLPDEFVAEMTVDLGEGIKKVVDVKLQRRDRDLKRRTGAGTGAVR